VEQWSMIQKRHKVIILVDERHLLLISEHSTKTTLRVAGGPFGDGLSIATSAFRERSTDPTEPAPIPPVCMLGPHVAA
jgi:hypothetical protein